MGKASREKGKRGEREVAAILRDFGYDARRGVQYQGGEDSPDVVGLPYVHIEVKRTERLDLYGALSQSKADAGDDMPIVVHRKNNAEWVVIQPLTDWLALFGAYEIEKWEWEHSDFPEEEL